MNANKITHTHGPNVSTQKKHTHNYKLNDNKSMKEKHKQYLNKFNAFRILHDFDRMEIKL